MQPDDAILIERCFSHVNEASRTVVLQVERVKVPEPDNTWFVHRQWADWLFLVSALWRLRTAARIGVGLKESGAAEKIRRAIEKFDAALPDLKMMRDVIEHQDDYILGVGRNEIVDRRGLQVGTFDDKQFNWYLRRGSTQESRVTLDLKVALPVGQELFLVVRDVRDTLRAHSAP